MRTSRNAQIVSARHRRPPFRPVRTGQFRFRSLFRIKDIINSRQTRTVSDGRIFPGRVTRRTCAVSSVRRSRFAGANGPIATAIIRFNGPSPFLPPAGGRRSYGLSFEFVPSRRGGSGGKSGRFLSPAVQDPPRIEVHHPVTITEPDRHGPKASDSGKKAAPPSAVRFHPEIPEPFAVHTGLFGYGGPPHPVSAAPACRKEPPARSTAPAEHPKGISRKAPAIRESGIQTAYRPRIPRIIHGFRLRVRSSDIRPNYRSRPHRPSRNRSGFSPNASTRLVRTALPSRYGKGENSARAPTAIGSNASAGAPPP